MLSYFSPLITEDIDTLILLVFFGVLVFGFVYVCPLADLRMTFR